MWVRAIYSHEREATERKPCAGGNPEGGGGGSVMAKKTHVFLFSDLLLRLFHSLFLVKYYAASSLGLLGIKFK